MIVEGTPNREIQHETRASATVSAVMSLIGTASTQRVNRPRGTGNYRKVGGVQPGKYECDQIWHLG